MNISVVKYSKNNNVAIAFIRGKRKSLVGVNLCFDTGLAFIRSQFCDSQTLEKVKDYLEEQGFVVAGKSDYLLYQNWLRRTKFYNRGK